MWARVCYPISPFPWPHFLAVNAAPSASLFIQVQPTARLRPPRNLARPPVRDETARRSTNPGMLMRRRRRRRWRRRQWTMVHMWRSTRAEIARLAGLKYPLKSA